MLTAERLHQLMHYEPITGVFTRLVSNSNRCKVGERVGSANNEGYLHARIDGRKYKLHRLAWLYMTGLRPAKLIDHIDMNPANNAWVNLREAGHSENRRNTKPYRNNTCGIKGVSEYKPGKWRAHVNLEGKRIHVGVFDNLKDAEQAVHKARAKLHGQYARQS